MTLMKSLMLCSFAGCTSTVDMTVPTTVTGSWDLTIVEGTAGGSIPAADVMQFEFAADGGLRFVSCLDPVYEGTDLLTCHEQRVCGTGTYSTDGSTLTILQTGRPEPRRATLTFGPGEVVLGGEFFGPSYRAIHFGRLEELETNCLPLP